MWHFYRPHPLKKGKKISYPRIVLLVTPYVYLWDPEKMRRIFDQLLAMEDQYRPCSIGNEV